MLWRATALYSLSKLTPLIVRSLSTPTRHLPL